MIKVSKKMLVTAAAVLVSGTVLAGAVFAADPPASGTGTIPGIAGKAFGFLRGGGPAVDPAERLATAVEAGKLSQGQADVLTQLHELRTKYMGQLKTESEALIDKAVTDGKITQEQADNLKRPGKQGGPRMGPKHGGKGGPQMHGRGGPGRGGPGFGAQTEDEVKAKLSEGVTAGKLTQEQADQMLKHWQEMQAKRSQQSN